MNKQLQEKMEKLQLLINAEKNMVEGENLKDISFLKKKRNESRNKAKEKWYIFRKSQEEQYRNILIENLKRLACLKEEKVKILLDLKNKKEQMKENLKNIKNENLQMEQNENLISEEEYQQEEDIQIKVNEHNNLLVSFKKE